MTISNILKEQPVQYTDNTTIASDIATYVLQKLYIISYLFFPVQWKLNNRSKRTNINNYDRQVADTCAVFT